MKASDFTARASEISRFRFFDRLLPIGVGLLMGNSAAFSQGVIFTERTVFNTALRPIPPSTTITFAGLPDPPPGIGRSPITVSGVTFTNNEARLFTGLGYLWNFDSSYPVGVFLPEGKNAFGADFSGGIVQNNPFNATLTFTLLDGQTFTHSFTGQMGTWTFLGFAFSQPIRNLVYDDGGPFLPGAHEEMLDNVIVGNAVVPEPQALAMTLSALITAIVLRKRTSPPG